MKKKLAKLLAILTLALTIGVGTAIAVGCGGTDPDAGGGGGTEQGDGSGDEGSVQEPVVEYVGTEGLEYTLSEDETYYICSGRGTATSEDIVIGSKYENLPVTEIGTEAFAYNNNIKNVTIPSSVNKIGKNAFVGCNLLNYNYSNGGLYLGNNENKYYAFINLSDSTLKSFAMENEARVIADSSLQNKTELLNVKLSKNLISVASDVLQGCISVTEISVPGYSEVATKGAFLYERYFGSTTLNNFNKLTIYGKTQDSYWAGSTIVFGDNFTSIGEYGFAHTSLTSVIIGDSVTCIEQHAFAYSTSLISVAIGDGAGIPNLHPLEDNGVL